MAVRAFWKSEEIFASCHYLTLFEKAVECIMSGRPNDFKGLFEG